MNKVLFMIIQQEVKLNNNPNQDHREWYQSLGLDPNAFETIIRGFIMNNQIIFYKGSNFMYDQEVIQAAKMYTPYIRYSMQNPTLEACCGITFRTPSDWEPIMKLQETEITGIQTMGKEEKEGKETTPSFELKNDYQDEKFTKIAIVVTSMVLIISFIVKIILFQNKMILHINKMEDILLTVSQLALLGVTIYGYGKKKTFPKYTGLAACLLLIFTFHLVDVLLGIFYGLFCIDYNIYRKILLSIKNLFQGKKKEK